ncbi:hypothetical protein GCM10007939_04240 [Amylibacter marinus]|uniref:Prolyl 3,4-dihydroxylase TPA1/OFD1 N-terminal domain-containing protein n=1 Tax=Amylibacter marinus TaxID=1475483 RepID=A0ABQ5VRZ4_9RHOB|nr:2OG-Fe(II) oxygenase family protein [Amylibacter marinus]GLQ34141.1 hypothetical protein GCM10007939_04240 [Amylibacter marinus]
MELTIATNELRKFMNATHLGPAVHHAYVSQFQSNALGVIQIHDFLDPTVVNSLAHFLTEQAIFDPIYGLYSKKSHRTDMQEWSNAPENDRFFYYEMLNGTKPDCGLSPSFLTYLRFKKFLFGEDFRAYVGQVTSSALDATTAPLAHRLDSRHYLKPHDDRRSGRKIAYILYLSPGWHRDHGGALCINAQGQEVQRLMPAFNSLVLFDVTAHDKHHIEPVANLPEGLARYTLGGWFYCE